MLVGLGMILTALRAESSLFGSAEFDKRRFGWVVNSLGTRERFDVLFGGLFFVVFIFSLLIGSNSK